MTDTSGDQHCCGLPVTEDGYCQHRAHHPRQITPELLSRAAEALYVESQRPYRWPGVWAELTPANRKYYLRMARASLEAVLS